MATGLALVDITIEIRVTGRVAHAALFDNICNMMPRGFIHEVNDQCLSAWRNAMTWQVDAQMSV